VREVPEDEEGGEQIQFDPSRTVPVFQKGGGVLNLKTF